MKRLLITLLLSGLSHICLYSQHNPEFGNVTYSDLTRTYNLKDKDASACVVHEYGRYSFSTEEDGNYIYNRFFRDVYIRIHILKQAGIEYANFEIPYYSSSDDVDKFTIEGYTYNTGENDMVIRTALDPKAILDEKVSDNIYLKKIAMPDAREGSIIEFHYKQGSRYFYMPVWEFQKDIPVLYSELRYEESLNLRYVMIFKGTEKFDVYEENDDHTVTGAAYASSQTLKKYKYGMRNLEAFEDVDFLRNAIDYRVAIYPQLAFARDMRTGNIIDFLSSWPKLRKDLLSNGNFGGYIKSSSKEAKKNIIAGLNLQGLDDAGKIEAIVRYVKNNYTWNRANGEYASKKLSEFLKEKTGNAGNMNLFLAGVLQAAEIESYPVILRLKSDGTVNRSYTFRDSFNFVVVMAKAGGKTYYLDATDTRTPFDMVSRDCINTEGFVVMPKSEEWVMITNPHSSLSFAAMTMSVDPGTGTVYGEVVKSYSGLNAVKYREMYGGDPERLEAMVKNADFILKEVSAEDYNRTDKPFKIKYTFETEQDEPMTDKIFIEPLSHLAPHDNIFKETQDSRTATPSRSPYRKAIR